MFILYSLGVQILVNLITDCPQEVQSLAAANLANMAKSSLGRNILKRHGGLQKLVRLHIKLKVAEGGEGLKSDSFFPESCLSIEMFRVMLLGMQERFLTVPFATKVYKWVSPNVCQTPTTFFAITSDCLNSYPGKHIIIISSEFYSSTI